MQLVHFAPFVPGENGPYDPKGTASHLLRRAGFGAPAEMVDQVVEMGLETAVDALFEEAEDEEAWFQDTFDRISSAFVDFGDAGTLQAWWCYRMLTTRVPLREKLTLFWHGHFATSHRKVETLFLMHKQCETLRTHGGGNFRDLLQAISQDPAMLVYLDGEANSKEHPNENFARELLELFTLGRGQYTEKDIREAARAFTGWHREDSQYVFHADRHDDGVKKFLGQEGPFDGGDILDIIVQQPALPRFLARKLLVFFACPNPPEAVIAEAATVFRDADLNVRQFLSVLFKSRFFHDPFCHYSRVASPVELVVGTCRKLGIRLPSTEIKDYLNAMGQELYAPPSVKGWEGEEKWINSSTWAARRNFARDLAALNRTSEYSPRLDVASLVPTELINPDMIVEMLTNKLLEEGRLSQKQRAEIARFLISNNSGPQFKQFRENDDFRTERIRAVVEVLLSLPEYHAW